MVRHENAHKVRRSQGYQPQFYSSFVWLVTRSDNAEHVLRQYSSFNVSDPHLLRRPTLCRHNFLAHLARHHHRRQDLSSLQFSQALAPDYAKHSASLRTLSGTAGRICAWAAQCCLRYFHLSFTCKVLSFTLCSSPFFVDLLLSICSLTLSSLISGHPSSHADTIASDLHSL